MITPRDAEIHRLIAGSLCLDFANTLHGHRGHPLHEYLWDYRDVVLWSRHAGLIDEGQAGVLLQQAEKYPDRAEVVHRKAIDLREMIFRIFSRLAVGDSPEMSDLDRLCTLHLEALRQRRLSRVGSGYVWGWEDELNMERLLWPIVISAVDLLTSEEVDRVRECNGDGCDWLFVDGSRNHLRRWCSMDQCGNRSKMKRRYAMRKGNHL